MREGLEIEVVSPLESRGYVTLTIQTLKEHGIRVRTNHEMSFFQVATRQTYRAAQHAIPGDYSSAAFLMSAAAVTCSKVLITGLLSRDLDPDSDFMNILAQMGNTPEFSSGAVCVEGRRLKAARVNIRDCPDLGPVLAVLGTYADGETELTGAKRLRFKESDRLAAIASELRTLGAEVEEKDDGLLISGPSSLHGATVESHGDHRIAMALAVAALNADSDVTIRDAECVSKSYPTFFADIRSLGVGVIER
jgi:3-phosphoshikimate 1-carboxyvinyltransferase